jgi:hypothetical protein
MAGIIQSAAVCTGGNHLTLTALLDGVEVVERLTEDEALVPMTATELRLFLRLAARRLRQQGVTFPQFVNRVLVGDEATNVKMYSFFGPGLAIQKLNIGTAYVNVLTGANGERIPVDLTGCTQVRFFLTANLVGTGAFGARCVRDGDSAVLIENANLGTPGERDVDSDWQPLPAAFLGQGLTLLRLQAKSTTPGDDPVFRRCLVGFR